MTDRLSGLDAVFLSLELPQQPMQAMALAILRPADGGETSAPITLDDVGHHVTSRLDLLPAFRRRVVPVPFGLHHPVIVDSAELDLDYHLRGAVLPAPGGSQELDRLYASLAETRLDHQHPLWRLTLVDGVDGGRQALILEIHHCLMDGAALLTVLAHLFSGEDAQQGDQAAVWRPERTPSPWRLVVDALADHGRGLARLPALVRKTRRGVVASRQRRAASTIAVPRSATDTPPCSLNAGFTPQRCFARVALPLTDVKLVKEVASVTVNDVVLSVVAGALRGYLEQRHDLPDRPLVANVPVGTDAPGDPPRSRGNRLTRLTTSLATTVADPWGRLRTISTVTRESKRHLELLGRDVMGEWLDLIPSAVARAAVRRQHRRRQGHPDHLDTNVTISNIRGPARPWSFGPAVIEEMYLTAPPNCGVGVTFAVWDYAGTLQVGILGFADSVVAPAQLAAGLSRSLGELVAIAHQLTAAGSRVRVSERL